MQKENDRGPVISWALVVITQGAALGLDFLQLSHAFQITVRMSRGRDHLPSGGTRRARGYPVVLRVAFMVSR